MSDDHSNTYTTATALTYGIPALGQIEASWDADYFRLTLQAGKTYSLALFAGAIEGLAPTKALIGTLSQLSPLASGGTGLIQIATMSTGLQKVERLNFTPSTSGDYYLEVHALFDSTAGYAISYDLADITPPAAPVMVSGIGSPGNHLSLKGTAEANSTVLIKANGVTYRSTVADSNGNWAYQETQSSTWLASGSYKLTAVAVDSSDNQSLPSTAIDFTLDTIAPTWPVWKESLSNSTLNTATPVLSGEAEAGAKITILDDSTVIGTTTARSDGTWSTTVSKLNDGAHTLKARATDAAGNISMDRFLMLTIATKAPSAPVVSLSQDVLPASLVPLEGTAIPNATLTITENGSLIFKTTVQANGKWSGSVSAVAEGSHTWQVTATDAAGNTSPATELKFKVDTTTPATPVLNPVASINGVTDSNQPLLSGSAEPFAAITVTTSPDGAASLPVERTIGTTVAGSDGVWQLRTDLLGDGIYGINVRATDAASHQSPAAYTQLTIKSSQNISGTNSMDRFAVTPGSHVIDGGAGIDSASLAMKRADSQIGINTEGRYTVAHASDASTQLLISVERLQFSDKSIALDVGAGANGGMVYRLYQAAFDRTPDAAGVGYWLKQVDNGTTMRDVANSFLHSTEFATLMGSANPDNKQFLSKLYANILHRAPDQAGYDYWINVLDKGADRAEVLAGFSEGTENQAQVIGSIKLGFEYTPFG